MCSERFFFIAVFLSFDDRAQVCLAVIYSLHDFHFCVVITKYTHIQGKGLKLFEQYLEGLRNTWFRNVLSFDDCFVCLDTSYNIIGFDCQDLLQCIRCTVGL